MTFKPGQSGNPGGRPKGYADFREQCRKLSPKVVARLTKLLAGKDDRLALDAGKALLEHAWGKPPQAVTGEGGEGSVTLEALIIASLRRNDDSG